MKRILGILSIVFLIACGGGTENSDSMSKADRLQIIKDLESKALVNVEKFDTATALALVKNYDLYANENPDDELTPGYLYKAVNYSSALVKPELSIQFIDRIIENYPDYEKTPYCMFLKGFIYEDYLNDLENAEKSYRLFIRKYPDHNMTDAAKFSLRNLGKSPEEILEELNPSADSTEAES